MLMLLKMVDSNMQGFILLVFHVILYSILGVVFYQLRYYFTLIPFYLYLGSLEILVSLMNSVYQIDLGNGIIAGGGNIIYVSIIWSILFFYVMEHDQQSVMSLIYSLIILQIFFVILYPFVFYLLDNDLVINPLNVPPALFQTGWWIFAMGNFLQLIEAIGMIWFLEKIKQLKIKFPTKLLPVLVFNLILIFDGLIFPILIIPVTQQLSLANGLESILLKMILGGIFSITFLSAITILNPRFDKSINKDLNLSQLIFLPRRTIIHKYRSAKDQQKMIRMTLNLLSHDIRNYNQITLNRVNLIQNMDSLSEKQHQQLKMIQTLQYESSNLVNNILNLNKVQTTELSLQPLKLNEVFEAALSKITATYPFITVNVHDQKVLNKQQVLAHPLLINVIYNILSNSIKYRKQLDQNKVALELAVSERDNYLILDIADRGKGIPNDKKSTIFQYKLDSDNSNSLGLYIVAEIMKAMNGKIVAENRVDSPDDSTQGTRMSLYLQKVKG